MIPLQQERRRRRHGLSLSPSRLRASSSSDDAVPPSTNTNDNTTTAKQQKYRSGSLMAATAAQGRVPYGEESRKYRRTVYTHDDWVDHRSNERLFDNLKGIFFSGVVRQLSNKISIILGITVAVVLWNDVIAGRAVVVGNDDATGSLLSSWLSSSSPLVSLPKLVLPVLPFQLSSPALGLLLVFRTNASYQRWLEGRKAWARISSQSRNIVRMATTFVVDDDNDRGDDVRASLDHLSIRIYSFARCLMNKLSGPSDNDAFANDLLQSLPSSSSYATRLLSTPSHLRPTASLTELSLSLNSLPIDEKRRVEIDKSLVVMGDVMDDCDRIFRSPVPLVYTRHTARFLSLYCLLLPLALYGVFDAGEGLALIPAAGLMALFLFGIEELSVQLEEPFSILPMEVFCQEIKEGGREMIDWRFGKKE